MKKVNIKPLADRVLIKPLDEEIKTSSGIIIPDTIDKERSQRGTVIAVGDGKIVDNKKVAVSVKVGDIVMFSSYSGDEIKVDGEEYLIVKEDSILAIIGK